MLETQLIKNLDQSLGELLADNSALRELSEPSPITALCGGGVAEKMFMYYSLDGVLLSILKISRAALSQPLETLKRQVNTCLTKYQVDERNNPVAYLPEDLQGDLNPFIDWMNQRGIECVKGPLELQAWICGKGHSGACEVPPQLKNAKILETTWGAHFYHWPHLKAVGLASTHTPAKHVDEWSFYKVIQWAQRLKATRVCLFIQTGQYIVPMYNQLKGHGINEIYLLSTFLTEQDPVLIELEAKHSAHPDQYPFLNVVTWEEGVLAGLVNPNLAMDAKITSPLQSIIELKKTQEA